MNMECALLALTKNGYEIYTHADISIITIKDGKNQWFKLENGILKKPIYKYYGIEWKEVKIND